MEPAGIAFHRRLRTAVGMRTRLSGVLVSSAPTRRRRRPSPHGLDIRSRFVYHTWDGKDLKLLPAKLRRRLPFGAAQGRTTSAERRQPTCRRQRRTPLPDDLRQRRLHAKNTQEALTRIVFSWENGHPARCGCFTGRTGVSPVRDASLGQRASRPLVRRQCVAGNTTTFLLRRARCPSAQRDHPDGPVPPGEASR